LGNTTEPTLLLWKLILSPDTNSKILNIAFIANTLSYNSLQKNIISSTNCSISTCTLSTYYIGCTINKCLKFLEKNLFHLILSTHLLWSHMLHLHTNWFTSYDFSNKWRLSNGMRHVNLLVILFWWCNLVIHLLISFYLILLILRSMTDFVVLDYISIFSNCSIFSFFTTIINFSFMIAINIVHEHKFVALALINFSHSLLLIFYLLIVFLIYFLSPDWPNLITLYPLSLKIMLPCRIIELVTLILILIIGYQVFIVKTKVIIEVRIQLILLKNVTSKTL